MLPEYVHIVPVFHQDIKDIGHSPSSTQNVRIRIILFEITSLEYKNDSWKPCLILLDFRQLNVLKIFKLLNMQHVLFVLEMCDHVLYSNWRLCTVRLLIFISHFCIDFFYHLVKASKTFCDK